MFACLAAVTAAGCVPVVPIDSETPVVMVPGGDMPPPGQCRVWYPGRPNPEQPSPGSCEELRGKVPEGAYLIRG
jgi:hypothetical protein